MEKNVFQSTFKRCKSYHVTGSWGAIELDEVVDLDDFPAGARIEVGVAPADLLAKEDQGQGWDHAAVVNVDRGALHL